MNEKLPAKLLKLKTLAEVPRAEYMDGPSPRDLLDAKKRSSFLSRLRKGPEPKKQATVSKGPVTLTFNAAAWMRVPDSAQQKVSLVICYKDSSGEYAVIVDEAEISESYSLMLSGCITIESKGTPEYVRACCAGLKAGQVAFVDELHVQRVKQAAESAENRKTA